jgi:hypothetical protein
MCTEMPRAVALRDVIVQIVQVARERADGANIVLGERLIGRRWALSEPSKWLMAALFDSDVLKRGTLCEQLGEAL